MKESSKNILLVACSVCIAIFLFNALLLTYDRMKLPPREQAAAEEGVPFDTRTRREFVAEQRAKGEDVWPYVAPTVFAGGALVLEGEKILPLSGISNMASVGPNESGSYVVNTLDELGFNNPAGIHASKDVDVALIGASLGVAPAVPREGNIAGVLNALGLTCINYSQLGNSAPMELATLSEYALDPAAKVYVWMIAGRDLYAAQREFQSERLKRYLEDPSFRQGLASRVEALDALLLAYVEAEFNKPPEVTEPPVLLDLLLLRTLRGRLGLEVFGPPEGPDLNEGGRLVGRILVEGKQRIEAAGGRLLVVYLPVVDDFVDDSHTLHDITMEALAGQGLEVLDFTPVMEATGDPLRFFPFRLHGHYNPDGYSLVAEKIYEYIVQNGWLSR